MHNLFQIIQVDSKLLAEFPFTGHGNTDNNLESPWIIKIILPPPNSMEQSL
jgi:hypothetical protein